MHRLPVLIVLAVVLSGCAPQAVASLLPGAGPLVTVTTRGGECIDGPCGSTVVVERDGSVRQTQPQASTLGEVPPETLAALDAAVKTTDFAAIRARPFTGECPTAFDGQEIVFEFGAPGGVQRVATCEVEVDFGLPLFAATSTALGPFLALPTT